MESDKDQNKSCSVQDSGVSEGPDSCGSHGKNYVSAINGQENKDKNDSGNLSGESLNDNKIVHRLDVSERTEFSDDRSVQNDFKRELNSDSEDKFESSERLENDCPIDEEYEMQSDDSDTSSFFIEEGQEPISTIPIAEPEKSGKKKESIFTAGSDYIPIYSIDHRNIFSRLMDDEMMSNDFHFLSRFHTALSQLEKLPDTFVRPLNIPVKTLQDPPASNVPLTKTRPKEIPLDLYYQSVKKDDKQNTPEMIQKYLFDKLARELLKIKIQTAELENNNHQLLLEREDLLQRIEMYQQHCKRFETMCENQMDVTFIGPPAQANVARPSDMEEFNEEHSDADFVGPKSIDIQRAKLNPPGEELPMVGLPEHPMEYQQDQQDQQDIEMSLRRQIKELQEELMSEREKCEVQKKRAANLDKMLTDERNRFGRDIDSLRKKIHSQEKKLGNSPPDCSKKKSKLNHSKQGSPNSVFNSGNGDKSKYIKQGAIPKN